MPYTIVFDQGVEVAVGEFETRLRHLIEIFHNESQKFYWKSV